jgi:hypothetical protein
MKDSSTYIYLSVVIATVCQIGRFTVKTPVNLDQASLFGLGLVISMHIFLALQFRTLLS